MEKKFDFDDILITPKTHTNIKSRFDEVNPYLDRNKKKIFANRLPLFTAPMDSVINENNYKIFNDSKIRIVLPRTIKETIDNEDDPIFHSYSLNEFDNYFVRGLLTVDAPTKHYDNKFHVLIDVANGHMEHVIELAEKAKKRFPKLVIMAGNIANPETYRWYAESNVIDYVRVGIGNGNGCLTTQQTGVGFPKASLIRECYEIKQEMELELQGDWNAYNYPHNKILNLKKPRELNTFPKIVADGGMKDYSDIIKALALGADYVMVGSIFNKALESSGNNYLYSFKISPKFAKYAFNRGLPVKKQFYGMSTKLAQKKLGNTNLKTSEGVIRYRKVEYTINNWVTNFEHYLRSAMSYSNARTLDEFIGKADFNLITESAFNRFKK